MTSLPTSCLFRIFLSSLSQLDTIPFFDIPRQIPLSGIFQTLFHYGNVSCFFRSQVLNALSFLLDRENVVFNLPKHQSQLMVLNRNLSTSCFNVHIDPSQYSAFHLPINNIRSVSFANEDDPRSEQSVVLFCKENDLSTVEKFEIVLPNLSPLLSTLLTSPLPSLRCLTLHTGYSVSSDCVFPHVFLNLISLRIVHHPLSEGNHFVDVSQLINLIDLSFSGCSSSSLTGLSMLTKLAHLELYSVTLLDCLNPNCQFHSISIDNLDSTSMKFLFNNRENFKSTRISIPSSAAITDSFAWLLQLNVTSLVVGTPLDDDLDETSLPVLPFLETLTLNSAMNMTIDLDNFPRLQALNTESFYSTLSTLRVSGLIYLQSLYLFDFNYSLLLQLLKLTPFLKTLHLSMAHCDDETFPEDVQHIFLNYLGSLTVVDASEVLSVLSPLPKLKTLTVEGDVNFDWETLNVYFPHLSTLDITNCRLESVTFEPNFTIKYLSVKYQDVDCDLRDTLFLLSFRALQHLSLILGFCSSEILIRIPPSVASLHVKVYHSALIPLLSSEVSLKPIGGIVYANDEEVEQVQEWVDSLKSRCLSCSLIVSTDDVPSWML
ncbi:hypothetical protein RCL1_009109 [Eukaryota sp. TZLM3-RCL]